MVASPSNEPPLTPLMQALLQAADCLVSPAPIPHLLLVAPLQPRVQPAAHAALSALHHEGWLSAPGPQLALLTAQSHAFLARQRSDEAIQTMVVQGLCLSVTRLIKARDATLLAQLAPHLLAMTAAWDPRSDRYAISLNLTTSTYLTSCGQTTEAQPYLERAIALDQALGLGMTRPPRRRWGWW
ncbi:MAG: hypothetical protein AB4911_25225 [Oscillochloridaceae bacterium umkhey_bin13]